MKRIALNRGMFALVDDEDFEWLNQCKWYASIKEGDKTYYVYGKYHGKTVLMHRIIMNTKSSVDHIDRDGLNNQKSNLRPCTSSQNQANRDIPNTNTSGYKGVSWYKNYGMWRASTKCKNKYIFIGYFRNAIDAARAYNEKAKELFGEFARLNDI